MKGVIEPVPVGEPTTWCSQMVIIQKKDGRPRRTVDFQKLNSQCYREIHHCQPPFILASQIPINVKKTVFDAVDGYHAIPLHEESKHLTTFITPWGTYRYLRLPQGFIASGDAYTRRYDELISDIPRKVKCVDDVLIWDSDITSAFYRAWDYLAFCATNGIVLSSQKFKFCKDEINFAGLKITKTGIAPSDKTLNAINNFPSPTNLTDARSWFGLVNQVSWAHSDSSTMAPFRDLIKPKSKFYWDSNLEGLFQESKAHLINKVKQGIKAFDILKPTCLLTDWSRNGMGFLLMQKHCKCTTSSNPRCCKDGWQLTFAGSRFTSEAESRYSPTEGEATAVAWSLNKSRFFTLGCKKLTIATDHQPLLGLFSKQLNDISNPRLLRIREKTLMFSFDVLYIPAQKNKGADAISRNPVNDEVSLLFLEEINEQVNDIPVSIIATINGMEQNSQSLDTINYIELKRAIDKDESYKKLCEHVKQGFPSIKTEICEGLQNFWDVRDRLTVTSDNVVLMDRRIVIPKQYRKAVLHLMHVAHQGLSTMKRRANDSVYWPRINNDLKNIRENCHYCNTIAPRHTKEPLTLTPDPEYPFQEVAADFFYVKGHCYLVLVDRFSGWFTVHYFKPNQATAKNLIHECVSLFSAYGAPEVFSSDGGPQFTSQEFRLFLSDWSIRHRISSPHYPQSNGRAEAAVKSAKRIISNYVSTSRPCNHTHMAHAIIQHRNTPLPDLKLSPAQLLFHRQLRDKIPTHPTHLRLHKQWVLTSQQREDLFKSKNEASMRRYNEISKPLDPLKPQTRVLILTQGKVPRWTKSGVIVMCLPFKRYKIKLDGSGRIVVRNRRFIRTCHNDISICDDVFDSIPASTTDFAPSASASNKTPTATTSTFTPPAFIRNDAMSPTSTTNAAPIPKKLLPYNNPGIMEDDHMHQFRTTRSGTKY